MNDFHDLLINRHSIRRYTDQPITAEQRHLILEAALLGPSSKSVRPWQFVVVDDPATLEALSKLKPAYGTSLNAKTPLAVVVGGEAARSDCWIQDASIAANLMQLQAAALGLGACWVEVYHRFAADGRPSQDVVREVLGIPDTIEILCVVTFGYSAETRRPIDPAKLLWSHVHEGRWSEPDGEAAK